MTSHCTPPDKVPDAWARVFFEQLHYFHRDWDEMKNVSIPVDVDESQFDLLQAHKKFVYYSAKTNKCKGKV